MNSYVQHVKDLRLSPTKKIQVASTVLQGLKMLWVSYSRVISQLLFVIAGVVIVGSMIERGQNYLKVP